jgi:hypothetical protein
VTSPDPMGPDAPMGRAGAVWCDDHQRWECSRGSQRHPGRCHAFAIRGTAACVNHAGKPTELAKAQGAAMTAWSALAGSPEVTANEAVLGMLHMSWLRVHIYAGLLNEQVTDAQEERTEGGGGDGSVGPGAGLVGHTYGAVKDVGIFATGEAVRGLAQLEAAERDRCVRYAKTAHDMGIAEQQVRMAEQQGELLAGVIRRILDALVLTAEQRAAAPQVVSRELRSVA